MTRLLTDEEINNILDFIKPSMDIPLESAISVVKNNKEKLRNQLKNQEIYPEVIPELKESIKKFYNNSMVQAGESVGVICAQSIGEKNTQTTLNSVDWNDMIFYTKEKKVITEPIGKMIDNLLLEHPNKITHIPENRTEYLELNDGYMIPSTDENGIVKWYRIEAITRHLPVGKLVKVVTDSGRVVTATQSKSFLVWNGKIFESTLGSNVKVGDIMPTTKTLSRPSFTQTQLGKEYTDLIQCDKIRNELELDIDFGFFIGIYLADGWCSKTFLCISSNHDESIRKRITDFCDRYGITYNLVTIQCNCVYLKIHSACLVRLICESDDKKIPDFVYTSPDHFIKGIIDGYFSGNVCIYKFDGSISASSIGENLILGISCLLSYYGIFGYISNTQNNIYSLKIRNDEKNSISRDRDVFFDKVVSVEYVEGTTEYVYDLTIEKTRNFQLFNGINIADTFHKCGQSEKTMTQGVPRFQELINATRKPRNVNHTIYLTKGNKTIEEVRETVGSSIVGLCISDISESIEVIMNKEEEPWYEPYKILYSDIFSSHKHCISVKLNLQKLFEFRISVDSIANFFHKEYDDLFCVFSPQSIGQLDIFADVSAIELSEDHILSAEIYDKHEIYLEECVRPTIQKTYITGIQGVTEIFYMEENK